MISTAMSTSWYFVKYPCIYQIHFERPVLIGLPYWYILFNPLSPHEALKHHFTSLKTPLFSYN